MYTCTFFSFVVSFFSPLFLRLLLGIDEEKKQIACGLVDTIGETKVQDYKHPILISLQEVIHSRRHWNIKRSKVCCNLVRR